MIASNFLHAYVVVQLTYDASRETLYKVYTANGLLCALEVPSTVVVFKCLLWFEKAHSLNFEHKLCSAFILFILSARWSD